ncbi:extracellular solute-binding protein [Patescibacteria group bacterium]|nr:extracellular solute-binding protein [Patescibacteria group bacterium]
MKHKIKFLVLILTGILLITSGFSCKLFPSKQASVSLTQTINLEYWGVWDESADLQPIINDFKNQHPNINITYRKFRYQEYEQKLLEAWAEDRGPDLYSIPVEWLKKYQNRITPQPAKVQLAFQEVKKTLGKTEISTIVRQIPAFTSYDIKNQFVDTVYNDVIIDGQIYGLPLSVDNLALFYNRDLLDAAGIATPPTNWTEVKEAVKKTTILNSQNNIIQAGIALGTAENIPRAVDIVSLLMMQNGAQMMKGNSVSFQEGESSGFIPGLEALKFYIDFADPIKEVYCWHENMPNALDAFIEGKVAMVYGYSYQLPVIKGRSPKLDIGIAPMTQIQGSNASINYANYWVTTVSHKVKNVDAGWGFLNFAARDIEVKKYLETTQRPAALRTVINQQKTDPELAVFAEQALTATHWYNGSDALKMEEIFLKMIEDFPQATTPEGLINIMTNAAQQINLTL